MKRYNETYTDGILFDAPGELVEFTKQSRVFNPSFGLWISGNATGIEMTFGGEISSGGYGVYWAADSAEVTVTRTGVICGETALQMDGENSRLENHGTIVGSGYGIVTDDLSPSIVNGGLISAPIGMSLRATDGVSLVNEAGGEIAGTSVGVILTGNVTTATTKVINHGVITAPDIAIIGSASIDLITNRGKIVGDVNLGDGSDRYDGRRGTIAGDVLGGFGDDTFIIDDSRERIVEGQNRGNDYVYSSADYRLPANVEALYLQGRKDLVAHGNDEDNAIQGNKGDNIIHGHDGTNILAGGRGDDILIGGSQRDSFVFNPGDGHDTIRNFQDGVDIFNVAAWPKFDDVQDILDHARERNGDVIISFGRDQLTIENCSKAQLDASDFPG